MSVDISLCSSCFMHCKYYAEVWHSLKNQEFEGSYEILVQHDGCDSGLGSGPARARNRLAARAKGKWLLFNDGDNVLPTNFLQALWNAKKAVVDYDGMDEEKLIVGCPVQFISGHKLSRIMNQAEGIYDLVAFNRMQSLDISVTSLVTKEAWDSVGGMDETDFSATEDLAFWCKLLSNGYRYLHTWETCLLKNNQSYGFTMRTPSAKRNAGFEAINKQYGLNLKPSIVVG